MHADFDAAATFVWLNARLLDRLRFAYHFLSGSAAPVVAAVIAYQNADGGFGNGLEADLRAPTSQPQPVEFALHILDEVGAFDHPGVVAAGDYLCGITTAEGGVPFVLASASDYPCAPWWRAEPNPPAAVNPTAAIAGLLHKHGIKHRWLGPATAFCWRAIGQDLPRGGYDYLTLFTFLEHVPDRERAAPAFEALSSELLAGDTLSLDPETPGHVFMPLDFAPMPSSPMRAVFDEEVIQRHLDGLLRRQQADGGWPITWEAPSQLAELEWRAQRTIAALLTLRAYGRLQ